MRAPFIILLLVVSACGLADRLRFSYTLLCNSVEIKWWKLSLQFKEYSNRGWKDLSNKLENEAAAPGKISGVVDTDQSGVDTHHNIYMDITHNCTEDGRTNSLQAYFKRFPKGTDGNFLYSYDVTNKAGTYYNITAQFQTDITPFESEVYPN